MLKLVPLKVYTHKFNSILILLVRYRELIFFENVNPVSVFLNELEGGRTRVIVVLDNNEVIGFVVLYDFYYISENEFFCYMYGASIRGVAKKIYLAMNEVFQSLKENGCVSVRIHTKSINLPVRFMARRFGFRKVGNLKITNNDKMQEILYEKIL